MKKIFEIPLFGAILWLSCLFSTNLNAQTITKLKLEEPQESSCRKIEEKLYLNSLLNKSTNHQYYIDSIKNCMGESPNLFLAIGRYFYNEQEYNNAIVEFKKVIELTSSNKKQLGEAFYYLALASYYVQEYNAGYSYAKKSLDLNYNISWTYNLIGLINDKMNNRAEAISSFKKSLKADPSNDVAANNLGWLYDKVHNDKEALPYYLYADSIVQGNKALYKSNIIFSLIQLQREREAFIIAENAYKKFPNDKNIIENYSKALFKKQQFNKMLPLARKLLAMHPSNANEWRAIAYIYHNAGVLDSAFYFYKLCLKYNPKVATAYDNIGEIYKELGMFEKAHEFVDMAISLDSNYHYFYSRKSEIYMWQHDFENSYQWALKCKQRFPERKGYELKIGYCLQQLKRYTEAITFFRIALANKPNDDRVLNNIGRCYAELGQLDSAFVYFQSALKINPENSYIYHNRAALYYDLQQYDLACQDLKQAIDKEYNWIIDSKLIEMKNTYCPNVNTNINILIHEYKGNLKELSNYSFIQLSDSLLEKAMDITILENIETKISNEESQTTSSFNAYNLYPNPTNGVFYIESQSKTNEELTVTVYNLEGKIVLLDNMLDGSEKSFNLQNTPAGTYVVMISNKNTVLSTKKLILEN